MNDIIDYLRGRFQNWNSELHFTTLHKRAFLILFVLVTFVSIAVVSRGHSEQIIETAPLIVSAPELTVDVAGGVKRPGVYSLPANSRVTDAIAAAGGARNGTDTSDINLARMIRDGEQIFVEPPQTAMTGSAPVRVVARLGPLNINRATPKELESLPGIGPVLAARIFAYRKTNGSFASIEDLQKVSGIGSAKFAELKSKVRV
jgi:competence protein ComEA